MAKIAFYKGNSGNLWYDFLNTIVRLGTFGPYSHVEYVDDRKDPLNPEEWMWYSASSLVEKKVRKKHVHIKKGHWDIYDLPEHNVDRVLEFFENEMGKSYDWWGVFFAQVLPLKDEDPEKWFCSEIVAKALQIAGLMDKNILPQQVSPNNLKKYLCYVGVLDWSKEFIPIIKE